MSLTQDQITRLKKLTALEWQKNIEISSVLESFSALQELENIENTEIHRSGAGSLDLRKDQVKDSPLADALLACSPQKIAGHQIVLGGIMIGEYYFYFMMMFLLDAVVRKF